MDHELLMQDMVAGYRTYAAPTDLNFNVGATTDAPALAITFGLTCVDCFVPYTAAHSVNCQKLKAGFGFSAGVIGDIIGHSIFDRKK